MIRSRAFFAWGVSITAMGLLSNACSGSPDARPARDSLASASTPVWIDSLALKGPGGAEVWYTAGRAARSASGTPCIERVMEVRRDGKKMPVPLLYTGERPVLVNDSTFSAHIWLNCEPGNLYQVSLKTAFPTYLGRVKQ